MTCGKSRRSRTVCWRCGRRCRTGGWRWHGPGVRCPAGVVAGGSDPPSRERRPAGGRRLEHPDHPAGSGGLLPGPGRGAPAAELHLPPLPGRAGGDAGGAAGPGAPLLAGAAGHPAQRTAAAAGADSGADWTAAFPAAGFRGAGGALAGAGGQGPRQRGDAGDGAGHRVRRGAGGLERRAAVPAEPAAVRPQTVHPDVPHLVGDFTNLVLLEVDVRRGGQLPRTGAPAAGPVPQRHRARPSTRASRCCATSPARGRARRWRRRWCSPVQAGGGELFGRGLPPGAGHAGLDDLADAAGVAGPPGDRARRRRCS